MGGGRRMDGLIEELGPRRIFRFKRQEVTRQSERNYTLTSCIICALNQILLQYQIKEYEMG
jgi:hypothetical protein